MQKGIAVTTGNKKAEQGNCILSEGSLAENFIFLQSGKVSIYWLSENETPYYLYSMQAPAVLGISELLRSSRYSFRWVADSSCSLMVYAGDKAHLNHIFSQKPAFALLAARSLFQELNFHAGKLKKALQHFPFIARAFSVLGLSLTRIFSKQFSLQASKEENISKDDVAERVQLLIETFFKNSGKIPAHIDGRFLSYNHLEKCEIEIEDNLSLSSEDFLLFKHFFALNSDLQKEIVKSNLQFLFMVMKKLSSLLQDSQKQLIPTLKKIDMYRKSLFEGNLSIAERLITKGELLKSENDEELSLRSLYFVFSYLSSFSQKSAEQFSGIWKISSGNGQGVSQRLAESSLLLKEKMKEEQLEQENEQESEVDENLVDDVEFSENNEEERTNTMSLGEFFVPEVNVSSALRAKILEDSIDISKKIMNYAGIKEKEQSEYEENLQKFLSLKDPFSSESSDRKIRRSLNTFYWHVYEKAALVYLQNRESLPKYMRLFFNYGVWDERLLDEGQIVFISAQEDSQEQTNYEVNLEWNGIYTVLEWLILIYDKKVPTSLNELGLTYFEILRQDNRDKKWKKESDLPPELDTGEARVKYEIKSMIETTTKLCSGSVLNHIAPLSRYSITRPLERSFVNKKRMKKMMENLLEIDFGVYHREVLFTDDTLGISREFIQKQVLPNVLLMPTAGHNFQFWQEREGREKLSPGRIMCPMLATEDLFQMFLSVSGAYRWEMTKTIMGVDWNNIAQSSLTADYTDYVQFFKKNKDLSIEAKEKLNAEFKRFRDDRSRFIHDYSVWVLYESEGRQKLNKVSRKILAKHIPFTKAIREELLKLPIFVDIVQRSINLRKKRARDLEPRYKKYRNNNNGVLPQELNDSYDYYNMEKF